MKGCSVSGVYIGMFQQEQKKAYSQNLVEIGKLVAANKLTPFISETIPMSDSVEAIERIAKRWVV